MKNLDLLPPSNAGINCRGERHQLRWESGELRALDHDDVDGELALSALGGEPTPCAQTVANWRKASDDIRVLLLASRGSADPLRPPPEQVLPTGTAAAGPFAWGSVRPGANSFAYSSFGSTTSLTVRAIPGMAGSGLDEPAADPLIALFQLSGGLPERLVATVATAWTQRLANDSAPSSAAAALTVALLSRVRLALQTWLNETGANMDVVMLAPGSPATIERKNGIVHIGLPFSWLADVWALGLTHILGRFTLAARPTGDTVELDTVGTGLDRRPVSIVLRT